MFATEDGGLHEGQLGVAALGAFGYMGGGYGGGYDGGYGGALSGPAYDNRPEYDDYPQYDSPPQASRRLDQQGEAVRDLLTSYSKLIGDWMGYTEEKWRAVSDSQLGWKPLRGRWNGWDEIYRDSFSFDDASAPQSSLDAMARRYDSAQTKGSAASSVACFLRDLDCLRQSLIVLNGGEDAAPPRMGGIDQRPQISQRTNKSPIIRNPLIVDADGS
jgi:hypothetical protein